MLKGAILTIGDEILIGQILNSNAQWISERFTGLGIEVIQHLTVGDKPDDILTALRLHGLGTQQPRLVWISLPRGVHRPTLQFPPLEMIHVQPELHRLQVESRRSGPIRLKVYGVEKTLVDCFRHRRRLGMEPVLEALKDAISQRRLNVDELWRQAQAQRMQRVMTPYLEALL